MISSNPFIEKKVLYWIKHHYNEERIQEEFQAENIDENLRIDLLSAWKKECHSRRSFTGIILMIIGAILGFISCVLSITNPFPELYDVILFGFTSVSITVIFFGLYYFFE